MNGARLLVESLREQGVDTVFGYPGGAIMPVYDALHGADLRHVLVRHEQAAVFAAEGWARATGQVGVCMATSGPGATNLVTGIADAYLDSVPVVAITGQVPRSLMGTDAFQEVDTLGITMPIVKHSFLVERGEDIPQIVAEAFRIAASGRPGPVVVDLPKDVAAGAVAEPAPAAGRVDLPPPPGAEAVAAAARAFAAARRPVIYVGGGVPLGRACAQFREFVERGGAPVVATLKGLGAVPTDHPSFLGMIGMHGTRAANLAVQECDLLLCVGARFDDRATGARDAFAPGARVVHCDLDPAEVGKLRRPDVRVVGDLRVTLAALRPAVDAAAWTQRWVAQAAAERAELTARPGASLPSTHAPMLLRRVSEAIPDAVVACDVGQHQMWVAQHWRIGRPERHLTSGGLGAMGFGLPAGIGAALAGCPQVVVVTGDGSIMMNIQELATVHRYGIPLKVIVLDNGVLGMVRQWQELFFERRYSEVDLSDNPDFCEVARAFRIPAVRVEGPRAVEQAIEAVACTRGPVVVHVPIDPAANVWPLVPPGRSNSEMIQENQP